jgi:hypothetical protein
MGLPQVRDGRGASARYLALAGEQLAAAVAGAGRVPAQPLGTLDLPGVAGDPGFPDRRGGARTGPGQVPPGQSDAVSTSPRSVTRTFSPW